MIYLSAYLITDFANSVRDLLGWDRITWEKNFTENNEAYKNAWTRVLLSERFWESLGYNADARELLSLCTQNDKLRIVMDMPSYERGAALANANGFVIDKLRRFMNKYFREFSDFPISVATTLAQMKFEKGLLIDSRQAMCDEWCRLNNNAQAAVCHIDMPSTKIKLSNFGIG